MNNNQTNRIVEIVQYGMGGVGRALLSQIAQHAPAIRARLGIDLRYRALVDSQAVLHLDDNAALSPPHLRHLAAGFKSSLSERVINQPGAVQKPSDLAVLATELDRLKGAERGARLVVVDVSGADETVMGQVLAAALRQGQRVVLANKRPLCGPLPNYRQLIDLAGPGTVRLRNETTVGAALPVISTLRALLEAQDDVQQISGVFSGTLGYLASRLEAGIAYSQAVREAKDQGFTEPDPRDDLGGVDVARKALILARMLGANLELTEVEIEPLYPASLAELSIADFMARLTELDEAYARRAHQAAQAGQVLRYVATAGPLQCRVGLESVDRDSPLGRLRGTDNLIVFQTARYASRPLVVQGPGAGADITASGVLSDIISLAR